MTKYIYSAGDYAVEWDKDAFNVTVRSGCAASVESSYELTPCGLGIALARARHKGGDPVAQARQHGVEVDDHKAYRRAEAEFCTQEGQRLFAMGMRSAHAKWLDE